MHIENNICDSFLGTLLDILGKSKNHINSRYDLYDMRIHKELQPMEDCDTGNIHLTKECFSMKPKEKRLFFTSLKDAKLPKGCASNISSHVQLKEMKVSGYKSHDAHFILHYLIQIAVRKVLPKNVSLVLIRLGNFLKAICSKVIRRSDLDKMKAEIIDIQCELEKIFPPSYFDIMTHLPIHLVDKIQLGGPTHLRWMYSTERNMCEYKGIVRNRKNPKGSIVEGCKGVECLTFCSRFLPDGVKTRFSTYQTKDDEDIQIEEDDVSPLFPKMGHPIGSKNKRKGKNFNMEHVEWSEAHRCALFNTNDEQVEALIKEFS